MGQSRDYSVRDNRDAALPSLPQQYRRHSGQKLQMDLRSLLPVQVRQLTLTVRSLFLLFWRKIWINRRLIFRRCRRRPRESTTDAPEMPNDDPAAKRDRWQVSRDSRRYHSAGFTQSLLESSRRIWKRHQTSKRVFCLVAMFQSLVLERMSWLNFKWISLRQSFKSLY